MKTVEYELPVHWATALFYGELDGLEDEDLEALEEFTDDMVARHGECNVLDVSEDHWFARHHDAEIYGVLACDVATFIFSESK